MRSPTPFLALAFALVACGHARPRPGEPPPARLTFDAREVAECSAINRVEGRARWGRNLEGARRELAALAGRLGADTVLVVQEWDNRGSVSRGVAYACPREPEASELQSL